jgi:hypothetical protein
MIGFLQYLIEQHEHGDFIRDEHHKPVPFYHGTTHVFTEFKPKFNKKTQHGFGVHFAYNPKDAENYTHNDLNHHGKSGHNPNMHKVHLRAKNVLDSNEIYHKDKHPNHLALHHALHKGTGRQAHVDSDGHFMVNPDVTNPQRAQKLIQHHGFDAVKYNAKESRSNQKTHKYPAITVFHPGQIHHGSLE